MKRKSFIWVFMTLVSVVLSMSSCSESKLNLTVRALDAQCPQKIGTTIELTHAVYENNTVVYYYTLDENYTNIDSLAAHPGVAKNNVLAMFQNPDADTKTFLDMVIEAKADVRFVYKGKTSGKEFTTTLTTAELEENQKNGTAISSDKLSATIASANKQMPTDTGEGIVITKIEDCGDVVFYLASVNDESTFNMISANAAGVKENIVNMLKMVDGAADKIFFKMIVDAGKSLGYRYSTEGVAETVDIVISNAELKEMFGE